MTREFKFRVMQFVAAYYDESTLCAGPIRVYNLSYGMKRISVYQFHRIHSITLDADGSVTFDTNTDAKIVSKAIVSDLRNFDEDLYKECSIKDEQYFEELVNNSGETPGQILQVVFVSLLKVFSELIVVLDSFFTP